jgi:capsular exopolysaccharide synthesis family protein
MDPRSPEAEAYRTLRTNIQFSVLDKPLRTLLVTSAGPDEGKTTTAANLAITLAQTGRTVILVDADLRRPGQHELFRLGNETGLTTLVLGGALAETVQSTNVEHLSVVTSGPIPPNPSELLDSRRMEGVVQDLAAQADYVVFDSPPVGAVTDAAVLASRVDGVVLVVSRGKTNKDQAKRAKALLERTKANVLGVVINNAKTTGRYY